MEGLELLKDSTVNFVLIYEIILGFFLLPYFPTLASSLKRLVGCDISMTLMVLYLTFTISFAFTANISIGLMLSIAALEGILTVHHLCSSSDQMTPLGTILGEQCDLKIRESVRDLALVTSTEEAVATVTSTLSACFSG